ncbi:ParA family protein [Scytonema tolypothrichoides VB-61278]|nr:ParA family protein [Scytonema tolypothrichoides VB-61278]
MARIIALANQKGGVGKTTTTINLGAALRERGRRVLLVDADPQASLSAALGVDPGALPRSLFEVLTDGLAVGEVIQAAGELTIVPATIDLAAAEVQLLNEVGRERVLSDALAPVSADYDDILIDCPPTLGILTINALTAASHVLIPVECHFLAIRGLAQLMQSVEKIQRRTNPRLRLLGILPTMYDPRNVHDHDVLTTLGAEFPGKMFQPIRRSVRFAESALAGKPILSYEGSHPGAQAYRHLAEEVLRA